MDSPKEVEPDDGKYCAVALPIFERIQGMTAGDAYANLQKEAETINARLKELREARSATPRGDKAAANRLLMEIQTQEFLYRRVMGTKKVYQAKAETQEAHGLWKLAVRVVGGDDLLAKCYEFMKEEKKRRQNAESMCRTISLYTGPDAQAALEQHRSGGSA